MGQRLAIVCTHPIQYYAPLFRVLSKLVDIHVYYAHSATGIEQAEAGFGVNFEWDIDVLGGYPNSFLENVASPPSVIHYAGCDTPEVSEVLMKGCFDAVLVMGWHAKSYIQTVFAAKRLGLPIMVRGDSQLQTPRSEWKRLIKNVGYPLLLRVFNAALYVGARSREYYRYYGYPEQRLFHSPHCIDNNWFASRATFEARKELRGRLGIGESGSVVLFAGKLHPFKRPMDALEAAALLRQSGHDVHVLVAGAGELESVMREKAQILELPLHILGFCNQTEMPAVYAASDVLVLPSSSETWGLVANEALACGCPVVVSDACGCAPDLVADGAAGKMFPVGDVVALSSSLECILTDPPKTAVIAAVAERYSVELAAAGIVNAMNNVFSQ